MSHVVVLGAGMVGSVIASDLAADTDLKVTVCDASSANLERANRRCGSIRTVAVDLSTPEGVHEAIADADVVAGALPSWLGLMALQAVIEAGTPYCDISFMPEDPLALNALAKERGVPTVVDCGVAPGLSHMLAARGASLLDHCESIDIFVGGLPVERHQPYEYKAGFSPRDVLEEYTRPARLIEHGRVVTRDALTEIEPLEFEGVGTLEAFNTDGLRSLLTTLAVPNMREKTLRYPGHATLMRAFRDSGFFDDSPVSAGGVDVRPIELTSRLLFRQWSFEPGEADQTVMRVEAFGTRDGAPASVGWDLLDRHDPVTDLRSMSRTTAFPCSSVVRVLLEGGRIEPGVLAPEQLESEVVDSVLGSLVERSVLIRERAYAD